MRNLVLVLGDQLDAGSTALAGFDPQRDRVLMIESPGEATHVWSHKARIVLFLSAMRHFADELRKRGWSVSYSATEDPAPAATLASGLLAAMDMHRPGRVVVVEPGELRVRELVEQGFQRADVPLEIRADTHFLCSGTEFAAWAGSRKSLRMEFFYREMRRRHRVLLDDGAPAGGRWNFDTANRSAFPKAGPPAGAAASSALCAGRHHPQRDRTGRKTLCGPSRKSSGLRLAGDARRCTDRSG